MSDSLNVNANNSSLVEPLSMVGVAGPIPTSGPIYLRGSCCAYSSLLKTALEKLHLVGNEPGFHDRAILVLMSTPLRI